MVVPFLSIFSFPLPGMLYALDRPDGPFKARLIGTVLYFLIIAPLSWRFGVNGAATAFVIGNVGTGDDDVAAAAVNTGGCDRTQQAGR